MHLFRNRVSRILDPPIVRQTVSLLRSKVLRARLEIKTNRRGAKGRISAICILDISASLGKHDSRLVYTVYVSVCVSKDARASRGLSGRSIEADALLFPCIDLSPHFYRFPFPGAFLSRVKLAAKRVRLRVLSGNQRDCIAETMLLAPRKRECNKGYGGQGV